MKNAPTKNLIKNIAICIATGGMLVACGGESQSSATGGSKLLAAAAPDTAVSVSLTPQSPGITIPSDFVGISFEGRVVLPDTTGAHFFTSTNTALKNMFATLGVKSLRIGGNSSETASVNPTETDRLGLFNFARGANVKVIFNLRAKTSATDPKNEPLQVSIANNILASHADVLQGFELSNEPDSAMSWSAYKGLTDKLLADIALQPNGSKARYLGPSTTDGAVSTFPGNFAKAYSTRSDMLYVSQHWYPLGSRLSISDLPAKRQEMLTTATMNARYNSFYNKFVPIVKAQNNMRFRLEETNSISSGGTAGVSDSFAASLWMLDYMHWWAAKGALGMNIHSGNSTSQYPNYYTAITPASPSATYTARPTAYGMKAFDLGGHGRVVPVTLNTNGLDITAYGVLGSDNSLYVTLINKSYGTAAKTAQVTLNPGATYATGQAWRLTVPNDDVAAKTGMTIGGAAIGSNGLWSGTPSTVTHGSGQAFTVSVGPASAAVIKLK